VHTIWLLARAWLLHRMFLLLIAEAATARYWWDLAVQLPTVERAIPMAAVLPPLLAITLSGALVELWPQQMETTARSPSAVRAARFAVVVASGATAAVVASGRSDRLILAATVLGIAIAGVAAPSLRRWTWMPLVLVGYAWMQYAAMHPYTAVDARGAVLAAFGVGAGGLVYSVGLPLRQTGGAALGHWCRR
jgi:hypothetical protein